DEPTTALTNKEVEALFRVILDLQSRGIAIMFVSHKLGEVFEISERFTILRNGKQVITTVPDELNEKKFAEYMTGRDFEETAFTGDDSIGAPVLEASGLTLGNAFSDVSFT